MSIVRSFGFVILAHALLGSAPDASAQAPAGVEVGSVSHAGSFCPSGSVDVSTHLLRARSTLRLSFDQLYVEAGPDVPRHQQRKTCQLSIDLKVPEGWTYAVDSFKTVAMYARIPRGSAAELRVVTPLRSGDESSRLVARLDGPVNSDVVLESQHASPLVFAPCGRPRALSINADVKVGPRGILTVDSVDMTQAIDLLLVWKRCR